MKLRSQLALVSICALLLPWAGCQYIQEMESALRASQQDALMTVSRSVAEMVTADEALKADITISPVADSADIYMHSLPVMPVVDGYPDETVPFAAEAERFASGERRLELYLGAVGRSAYLLVDVAGDPPRYRTPGSSRVTDKDHLQLVLAGRDGDTRVLWISPEGPGRVTAKRKRGARIMNDSRVSGYWLETPTGYRVELELQRDWLGTYAGVTAVDGLADEWVGTMPPAGKPGRLIRLQRQFELKLGVFSQPNLRLSVVDKDYWLQAVSGELAGGAGSELAPGAWMLTAVYAAALAGSSPGEYASVRQGRVARDEITSALAGTAATRWYELDENNYAGRDAAVISAAAPVYKDGEVIAALVAEQSSAGNLSLTNAALVRLASLSFVAMAIILLVLIGYAGVLSSRIRRLGRDVSRVMDDDARELQAFPPQTARDELGGLGRSFGELLIRVQAYTDYLRTLASKLSHELRTPLAVVRSSVDNLEHEDLSPEAREYLARARSGSERLEHILNAMSAASRVEQSIKGAEKEALDLSRWLTDAAAAYRSVWPDRRIELNVPAQAVIVDACPELLAQLLDKLMDNANDFCPASGVISIGLAEDGGEAVLTVENDGPTLPDGMAAQLFESMVSVREVKTDNVHMGLGLTIVRLVTEYHGGSVGAANRATGSGVCFTVRLPLPSHKKA